MRRVALLGATGSIGRQAMEVVSAHPDLALCALQSGSTPLDDLAADHGVEHVQIGGDSVALLERSEPDIVLNAVVGFAGVEATLWALESGVTLALANKESLVAAGELAVAAQARGGGLLLPGRQRALRAPSVPRGSSARDARRRRPDGLRRTVPWAHARGARRRHPEEALRHPTWSMGPKITIDSATLANKGLELIEAHWLFGVPYERIEVVVHPTSVVHALARFRDGALLAHVGLPDMRVPISYALTYPERASTPVEPLDLEGLTLAFERVDDDAFPLVALARAAGERGGTAPCAFNAANEVAVAAFLEGRLRFPEIAEVVVETLEAVDGAPARDLADLVEADDEARRIAARRLQPA